MVRPGIDPKRLEACELRPISMKEVKLFVNGHLGDDCLKLRSWVMSSNDGGVKRVFLRCLSKMEIDENFYTLETCTRNFLRKCLKILSKIDSTDEMDKRIVLFVQIWFL